MGVQDDTMIVFASDNGLNQGVWNQPPDYRPKASQSKPYQRVPIPGNGPLRGCKWTTWDGGIRTPMFAYIPDGQPQTDKSLRHIMDIMPTALDFAGIETDITMNGKSFLSHLHGNAPDNRDRTLCWAHLDAIPMASNGLPTFKQTVKEFKSVKRAQIDYFAGWCVRQGDWKLVGWQDTKPYLFNITNDPGEQTDVARSNQKVVRTLRGEFIKWMQKKLQTNCWKPRGMESSQQHRLIRNRRYRFVVSSIPQQSS